MNTGGIIIYLIYMNTNGFITSILEQNYNKINNKFTSQIHVLNGTH